ncbi:enoyl-CoA hydratase-related protein [Enhydrobacter sp.]|jgi:methylglutaconyl-CoA hydratase|uniref:enoyl-CoA hydratase/isomerase family protein n=1 Tax=Enhydrobacter sp. TaxID=1894999 RepID=UPI00262728FE|nr:enoyl-CoA hydratase-related protein [Enhydrobacter sp.]WIM13423.1 MAG: Enoyl-CoA hydratase [Enhydrobacter sp.]
MGASIHTAVEDGIAILTLKRDKEMNSLDAATARAVCDAIAAFASDPAVRVLVLAGEGPAFSAGGDFNWVLQWPGLAESERRIGAEAMMGAVQAVYDFPKPSIARVHGAAVGGGIGLMLACDYAIVASTARFGLTSARNGLLAAIAIPVLIEAVGPRVARQLLIHGGTFDAVEAERLGLVDRVVEPEALEAVNTLARELKLGAPSVQALVKKLVPAIDALPHDSRSAAVLSRHVAEQCVTAEALEGMQAFLDKRKPRWAV